MAYFKNNNCKNENYNNNNNIINKELIVKIILIERTKYNFYLLNWPNN